MSEEESLNKRESEEDIKEQSKCYGCENGIMNQEGHMYFNGCLYDSNT